MLPPPISTINLFLLILRIDFSTPIAVNCASTLPVITSIFVPIISLAQSVNSPEFLDSLTTLVATALILLTL